uniref:TGB3 n=1 Tax=Garlic virus A TaxID=12433 RepID=A0A6M2YVU6_9VIRU|nr:TGB3 [Garlic virus A]QED44252.1 TGB3 [Garlic virus A]
MVIVTTFHIDQARDLVINNSNSIRDCLLNKLHTISNEVRTVGAHVDSSIAFNRINLQTIYNHLSGNNNSSIQMPTAANPDPLLDPLETGTATVFRTFFSNAALAVDATRTLLGYVPPARYNIPPSTLPLDELYGQLHALHQNTLEWLTHISHNVDSILTNLNPINSPSQNNSLSQIHAALTYLTRTVDSLYSNSQSTSISTDQPSSSKPLTKLEGIEQSLEALHRKIDELSSSLTNTTPGPSVTPNPSAPLPTNAARNLPIYQAAHPSKPCRTYGTILLDGVHSKIPMDIIGRPASTALRLELRVTPSDQSTTVSYKIFDDGYLLTSDDIETNHRLQHYPSDCLALLHQKCPNFIYKIKTHDLC